MIIGTLTIFVLLVFLLGAFNRQYVGFGYGLGRCGMGMATVSVVFFSMLVVACMV